MLFVCAFPGLVHGLLPFVAFVAFVAVFGALRTGTAENGHTVSTVFRCPEKRYGTGQRLTASELRLAASELRLAARDMCPAGTS